MTREAIYGGGTTCPDGLPHQGAVLLPNQCWRCDAHLKPMARREGASRLVGRPLDENGAIRFRILRKPEPEGIQILPDPSGPWPTIERAYRRAQRELGWGHPVGCRCVDCESRGRQA